MNNPLWPRLVLAGVCGLVAVSTASAQRGPYLPDDGPRPSHRTIDGLGDLSGAEDLLARRLHHTHDLQQLQDMIGPLLNDPKFRDMVKDKFKDVNDRDLEKVREEIQKNPELLDDPKLRDMLKDAGKYQQGGARNLSKETQDDLAKWAKGLLDKEKPPDLSTDHPIVGGGPVATPLTPPAPTPPTPPPPALTPHPTDDSPPSGLTHDFVEGVAGLIKDIDRSPEGEALRAAALRELARLDSSSSGSSSFADAVKNFLSSDQATWLAHALNSSSSSGSPDWASAAVAPSGGSTDGVLGGVVWVAALALLGAAAWVMLTAARRRAARARKAWSPGPWPVDPSRVSTRQDLVRAFEHLAYLLLGPTARSLNHLDLAERLGGEDDGRAGAAGRLAHLYEQARYAPPDEPLPGDDLTAARGDLAALAGAAA